MDYRFIELSEQISAFIFNKLGARYSPQPVEVSQTLNFTDEQLRMYLGTYWPRSVSECFGFFSCLLDNPGYMEAIQSKKRLRILDVGSGTGGALMGVLLALSCRGWFRNRQVEILSIDGNETALGYQRKLIGQFFPDRMIFTPILAVFQSRDHLAECFTSPGFLPQPTCDIMICSKFVNEFYRTDADYHANQGLYETLAGIGERILGVDGLLLLLDVNDLVINRCCSFLLNQEIHQFLAKGKRRIVPVLPQSCMFWYDRCRCTGNCFTQVEFTTIHTNHAGVLTYNRSKVSVKALATRDLAGDIRNAAVPHERYTISRVKTGMDSCERGVRIRFDPRKRPCAFFTDWRSPGTRNGS